MSTYCYKITSKQEQIDIQELLFSVGFGWYSGEKKLMPYSIVDRYVIYNLTDKDVTHGANKSNYTEKPNYIKADSLEYLKNGENPANKCICGIFDLMNNGCQCGDIERERGIKWKNIN